MHQGTLAVGLQIKQLHDILFLSNFLLVCVISILFTILYDLLSLSTRRRLDGGLMHLICWSSQVMTEVIWLWMQSWPESSSPMMESATSITTMNMTSPLYWSANIYICIYNVSIMKQINQFISKDISNRSKVTVKTSSKGKSISNKCCSLELSFHRKELKPQNN